MIIKYLGHATFYIEGKDLKAIIDPFITGNPQAPIEEKDIEALDYIFVTHGHGDHLGDTIPLAKRTGATVVANYEIILYLEQKGLKNLHPMHIGGRFKFPFGDVLMTEALHGSSIQEGEKIIYAGNPGGFVIEVERKKIYHAGDTGLTLNMQLLEEENIDIALLPIGGNFVMDVKDAIRAVDLIKPEVVIPMHYNTWDIIKADVEEFKRLVKAKCIVLKPGESYAL